jgi:hypothetical protein
MCMCVCVCVQAIESVRSPPPPNGNPQMKVPTHEQRMQEIMPMTHTALQRCMKFSFGVSARRGTYSTHTHVYTHVYVYTHTYIDSVLH